MYIKEIRLQQFRNYQEQHLQFHRRLNVITGNNAQGKTNLLESIYIMSMGRSFRTNKDSEMIGFGKDVCQVTSVSIKEYRETENHITYRKSGKLIKIDGVRAPKISDMLKQVYAVVFSPEDLKIVKEEPEKRRKFIDRELCQIRPVYYKNLGKYKKILQNRNILLKEGNVDRHLLSVYDEELAFYGAKIICDRDSFITKLQKISKEIHQKITDGKENLEVSYESNIPLAQNPMQQKEVFLQRLKNSFVRDLSKRNTESGPHRDDLNLQINGIDMRRFGSQGQQRTAALSLKLAEIYLIREETGEDAVLLLDDVLSELDVQRQTFLLNRLRDIQIFITTTEISDTLFNSLVEGSIFSVENGVVRFVETVEKGLT